MAAAKRGMFDCPFCRTPYSPDSDAVVLSKIQARVEKKDHDAINCLGEQYCKEDLGLQQSERKAVELWKEAAELGSIKALYNLGISYYHGRGVGQKTRQRLSNSSKKRQCKDMLPWRK